jgi:hypothetical protein
LPRWRVALRSRIDHKRELLKITRKRERLRKVRLATRRSKTCGKVLTALLCFLAAEGTPQAKRQETIPTPAPAPVPVAEVAPPNKLLFVQNLPDNMTKNMLEMLFQKYPGLKEVRLVAGKAFVEFDHEINATTAMMGYNGFKVSEDRAMVISYARV